MTWGPFDLEGKTAVVTGGARGVGFGIVHRFAEAGANVVMADIDEVAAQKAIGDLGGVRGRPFFIRADVRDPSVGDQLVSAAEAEFGSVDILVNNAGVYPKVDFTEMTSEVFDDVFGLNMRGLYFLSQGVAKAMIARGNGGVIIHIASIGGLAPEYPGLSAYGSSKASVIHLTKNMAVELAEHGIRVMCIAPGGIETEGTHEMGKKVGRSPEQMQSALAHMATSIPIKRFGVPDDIGYAAVYLASPAGAYTHGSCLVVDGGALLHGR
jgi:2-dehydro-3-deoxy-D-gluconate 5-dehydrogenase